MLALESMRNMVNRHLTSSDAHRQLCSLSKQLLCGQDSWATDVAQLAADIYEISSDLETLTTTGELKAIGI